MFSYINYKHKKMTKKHILIASMFLCFFGAGGGLELKAQYDVDTSKAAYYIIPQELNGYKTNAMSDNCRYYIANREQQIGDNIPCLWDIKTNTFTKLPKNSWAHDVSNDGVVVGQFCDTTRLIGGDNTGLQVGGYFKDGKWNAVDLYPGYIPSNYSKGSNVYSITPDGKTMVGHVYMDEGLVPAVWENKGQQMGLFITELRADKDPKYGGRRASVRAVSANGESFAGWNEAIQLKPDSTIYYKGFWIPSLWIGANKDSIPLFYNLGGSGTLSGINADGSIAVGASGSKGLIINKKGKSEVLETGALSDVSENGIYVGQSIYEKKIGIWSIPDYFALYGLDDEAMQFAMDGSVVILSVSDNGEFMCGYNQMKRQCFFVRVSGARKPLPVGKLQAVISVSGKEVILNWEAPRFQGSKPKGYNIYRENQKINTALVSFRPGALLQYTDTNPVIGRNNYRVTAVFQYAKEDTLRESALSEEASIEVVVDGGCYSPKHLSSSVIYNRTVNLAWRSPFPSYAPEKAAKQTEDPYEKEMVNLSLLSQIPTMAYFIGSDNEFLYTTTNGIVKQKLDGSLVRNIKYPIGRASISALCVFGDSIYGIVGEKKVGLFHRNPQDIKTLDTLIAMLDIPITNRASRLNVYENFRNGERFFEIGLTDQGVVKSTLLDKNFQVVGQIGDGLKGDKPLYATAYHNGIIYGALNEPKGGNLKIYLFDAKTLEPTGKYIDLSSYANLKYGSRLDRAKVWGMTITRSSEGLLCLAAIVGAPEEKYISFFELESMEGLLGYDVYRSKDGSAMEKQNTNPLKDAFYTQEILHPGKYKYEVKALFDKGNSTICTSDASNMDSVEIKPLGVCYPVKNLAAKSLLQESFLTWNLPEKNETSGAVGFNVFRNGVKLNEEFLTFVNYQDLPDTLGSYNYVVETFYDNSCSAKDSVMLIVGDKGNCMPVNNLVANIDTTSSVQGAKINWSLPYFEEPYPLRYDGGIALSSFAISDQNYLTIGIAWDSLQLKKYKDCYIVGVEFHIGDNADITHYVFVDNKEIIKQSHDKKLRVKEWNTIYFDQWIPVANAKKEIAVAFKGVYEKGANPFSVGKGPAIPGYGDLVTLDSNPSASSAWYKASSVMRLNYNWAMAVLLAKPREIASTQNLCLNVSNAPVGSIRESAKDVSFVEMPFPIRLNAFLSPVKSNKDLALLGFDLYRNGEKINSTPLVELSYADKNLKDGEYSYMVNSLWNACDAVSSKEVFVIIQGTDNEVLAEKYGIKAYPNPAKDQVFLEGNYQRVQLIDLMGRVLLTNANTVRSLDVSALKSGIYLLKFHLENGQIVNKKLAIN